MSFIQEIEEAEAQGDAAAIYERIRRERGRIANILKVQGLRPLALAHHLDLYLDLMFGPGRLTRAQREMIAVVVSRANRCEYCVSHHREALARYVHDGDILDAIEEDPGEADLPLSTRALLDYARTLTLDPSEIGQEQIDSLRERGFSDEDILHANLIAAYFNFVNRIALGLGVPHSPDEVGGYKAA